HPSREHASRRRSVRDRCDVPAGRLVIRLDSPRDGTAVERRSHAMILFFLSPISIDMGERKKRKEKRSEERRVGKECRSGRWPSHEKEKRSRVSRTMCVRE